MAVSFASVSKQSNFPLLPASEADMQYLEKCLELDGRTYNSHQLALKLSQERNIKLSPDRLRHILQKRGFDGNVRGTVIEQNKTLGTNAANKRSWMLSNT